MLTNKHKEGVMEVRRHLVETASKEKLPIKMSMGKKLNATDELKYLFHEIQHRVQTHIKNEHEQIHVK